MTTTRRTRVALAAGVIALAVAAPRAAEAAEALYGVAGPSTLVTFHSDSPGAIRSATEITGLQPGEQVLALDLRPLTGQLYALGSSSRVYVLSPVSGAARAVGDPLSPPLAGSHFGLDFNPAIDRIRLVSDGRQNLRVNPDNGAVTAQDGALDYADDDAGAGANPQVAAAAYTPDGSALFAVDAARDALLALDAPNSGRLRTVGPLGRDLGEPVAFDIAADGTGFVSGDDAGTIALFRVDAATGALARAARRAQVSGAHGEVRAITATGPVADDDTAPAVAVDADRHQRRDRLGRGLSVPVSCNEACEIRVRLGRGSRRLATGGDVLAGPGLATVRLRLNARAGRLSRGTGRMRTVLRVRVVDMAGNRASAARTLLFG
jgi:hypothetical protein